MCLSNFKAIRQFKVPISWLRDFTRSYEKTSFRILRRGPALCGLKLMTGMSPIVFSRHLVPRISYSIVTDNHLTPNRRQAITWASDEPVHWHLHVYASPGFTAGTRRNDNVIITSKRRRDFGLTLLWRCYCAMCPLGSSSYTTWVLYFLNQLLYF